MPTKIEWCQETWNPVTGCSHAGSPGCDHCYAKRMAQRLKGRYGYPKDDPFKVTSHPDRLDQPLKWEKPRRIFVVSMGDLFHEDVKYEWTDSIWSRMAKCPQHTFLVLTKRPERMSEFVSEVGVFNYDVLPNLWLGVTAENQATADERIPILLQIPAAVRFVSVEPMLSEIWIQNYLNLYEPTTGKPGVKIVGADMFGYQQKRFIDWVIVGGESGPCARPMHPDWARSIRDQCKAAGVPFFFKQWGKWMWWYKGGMPFIKGKIRKIHKWANGSNSFNVGKKKAGRILDGRTWDEYPK